VKYIKITTNNENSGKRPRLSLSP